MSYYGDTVFEQQSLNMICKLWVVLLECKMDPLYNRYSSMTGLLIEIHVKKC